jgi:hypothetical protein
MNIVLRRFVLCSVNPSLDYGLEQFQLRASMHLGPCALTYASEKYIPTDKQFAGGLLR